MVICKTIERDNKLRELGYGEEEISENQRHVENLFKSLAWSKLEICEVIVGVSAGIALILLIKFYV